MEVERKLRNIYNELAEQFNFTCPCPVQIVISNRLRSSNGTCRTQRSKFINKLKNAKITMSKALLDEFGWDKFETTFRHEVAHLAQTVWYGKSNHDETFKSICSKFGGSMNTHLAGVKYAHCADTNYVKTIKKWHYECPCGIIKKMARRMNKRKRGSRFWSCGKCGATLATWKEIRVA